MSNYKVGDKFVLEVQRTYKNDAGHTLYGIKGFNALVFDKNGLDKLSQVETGQGSHDIIGRIKKEAYEDGMNEAWDIAKLIALDGYTDEERRKIFGSKSILDIFLLSPQEVAARIEAFKKKNAVKIGDVLKVVETGYKGIVIQKKEKSIVLLFSDGSISGYALNELKETDRWVDLEMILDDVAEGFKK